MSLSRLNGKVAIVTASTDGIGYAIAKRLGIEGASVVVSSRKEENVNRAVMSLRRDGIEVEGVVCHVGDTKQRTQLFDIANKKFGGLDIVVSNAAVNPAFGPILEVEESAWDKIFDVNVKCSWLLAKEAYPEILKRGGGNIVFISSIAAYQHMTVRKISANIMVDSDHHTLTKPLGSYSVSKTALLGLTKAIAKETVQDNIRVNCVAPGIVSTKFASILEHSNERRELSLSLTPMNRFARPEEISGAVAFLVSEDASFVTGETVVVAGGMNSHL